MMIQASGHEWSGAFRPFLLSQELAQNLADKGSKDETRPWRLSFVQIPHEEKRLSMYNCIL